VWQCRKTAIFCAFRDSSAAQPLESCRLSAPVFDRHVNASERIDTCPLPASDWLQKGKGGWMQFFLSSLPYFISPFVKRPQIKRKQLVNKLTHFGRDPLPCKLLTPSAFSSRAGDNLRSHLAKRCVARVFIGT